MIRVDGSVLASLTGNINPPTISGAIARPAPISASNWCFSMPIKVARVPYMITEAFYNDMERRGLQLHDILPSGVAPALQSGEIDAGPVPLAESFYLGDGFEPVSGFCVATTEKAGSVLLYSEQPIEELTGARIAVTSEAATSFQLLQVLLLSKHRVQPEAYVTMEDPYDAFLLTDDQGLRRRRGARGYPHRYDLGEEWFQWTGLPFVFSRWIARKGMDPKDALLLEDTLYVGLEMGVEEMFHESEPRESLLMLPKDIVEYIQGLRFFMGLSERKAVELFRQYVDQLELKV